MAEHYSYQAPPPFPGLEGTIVRESDNSTLIAFIPLDLDNTDYQAFLAWMAECNPAPAGWTGPTNTG